MATLFDRYWDQQLVPPPGQGGPGSQPHGGRRVCATCHEFVDRSEPLAVRTRTRVIGHSPDCAALAASPAILPPDTTFSATTLDWSYCVGT